MKQYYVYILFCNDGTYYVGVTNNLQLRISQHNNGCNSRSYTFTRRPLILVYQAEFTDIRDAIAWEKKVKRWSRKKKEALIMGEYERLPKLAECKNETHYRNMKELSSRAKSRDEIGKTPFDSAQGDKMNVEG